MRREIASRHYVILDRLPEDRFEHFRQDLQTLIAALREHQVRACPGYARHHLFQAAFGRRSHFADPLAEDLSHAEGRRLPRHGDGE